jgi:hypothetical protein
MRNLGNNQVFAECPNGPNALARGGGRAYVPGLRQYENEFLSSCQITLAIPAQPAGTDIHYVFEYSGESSAAVPRRPHAPADSSSVSSGILGSFEIIYEP